MNAFASMRVLVAGSGGLIGAALLRALEGRCGALVGWRMRDGDLRDRRASEAMFDRGPFDLVFLMAATQGGIADHKARPAAYASDNARIALNVIDEAARRGAPRLVYAASGALYPDGATRPLTEDMIASGPIEASHRPYAAAKLLGVRLCEAHAAERGHAYASAIINNTYGPGGTFDPQRSTLIHGMITRAVESRRAGGRRLSVWGTGRAKRDVLYVDDAATALLHVAAANTSGAFNIASGVNRPVGDIAAVIARAAGLDGVDFDPSRPEGALSRAIDISRIASLGFTPRIDLETGVARTMEALAAM